MKPLEDVVEHYTRTREADRLRAGPGELERLRTEEIISRYLVPAPARILDVGGGPGVYASWLLGLGYEVDLIDPVPAHVQDAAHAFREEELRGSASLGDARELEAEDGSCDAVLLLGPLYHLPDHADRLRALAETKRVLRPGGFAFLAAISRFASLLDGFARGFVRDPDFVRIMKQDLVNGQHRNPGHADYFTTAFLHRPDELVDEIRESGLELHLLAGVEGPFWCIEGFQVLWADASTRTLMLEMARQIETEPAMLGASAHWLAVVQRTA